MSESSTRLKFRYVLAFVRRVLCRHDFVTFAVENHNDTVCVKCGVDARD